MSKPIAYVAAALFNERQIAVINRIAAVLTAAGVEPFLPHVESQRIWKGRAPKDCTAEDRKAVLTMNKSAMDEATYLIARVSGDTKEIDTGVAWELGYFYSLHTAEMLHRSPLKGSQILKAGWLPAPRRILVAYIDPSDRAQSLNLMVAETVHAAVYGDAQLHALISELQDALGPQEEAAAFREHAPDKIILHEREPVGFTDPHDEAAAMHSEVDNV